MERGWKYNLGDKARILVSGEVGHINGKAEYTNSSPQYRILYKSADGRAVEAWWYEDQIEPAD